MIYVQITDGYVTDCVEYEVENYIPVTATNPHDIMNGCYQLIKGKFLLDEIKYEEFLENQGRPKISEEEYKSKVRQYVHEVYSLDDEASLINEAIEALDKNEKLSEKYLDYREYVEECKIRALEVDL